MIKDGQVIYLAQFGKFIKADSNAACGDCPFSKEHCAIPWTAFCCVEATLEEAKTSVEQSTKQLKAMIAEHVEKDPAAPEEKEPYQMPTYYILAGSHGVKIKTPVGIIANSRAAYYAKEFGGDVQESLDRDTGPLFAADNFEIEDWAKNSMDWKEVQPYAEASGKFEGADADFLEEVWLNGEVAYA